MRRLAPSALAVLALTVAACSDDPDEGTVDAPTTTEARPTTESTEPPDTTPTTVDFATEVRRAAVDLLETRNDVFQNPAPEQADAFISTTCDCRAEIVEQLTNLSAQGAGWSAAAIEVRGVRLLEPVDSTLPRLVVIARQAPIEVVDGLGRVVERFEAIESLALSISLIQEAQGWRLNRLESNPSFDPALAEEITSDGLP